MKRHKSNNDNYGRGVRGGRGSSWGGDDQMTTKCVPVSIKTKGDVERKKRLNRSNIRVQLEEIEDQKKSNSQVIFEHKQARSNDHKFCHQKPEVTRTREGYREDRDVCYPQ